MQPRGWALHGIARERTALAVIDVQQDFCSGSGVIARGGDDVSTCSAVAERLAAALPQFRRLIDCVCFFRLFYDPPQMSTAQQERLIVAGRPVICDPDTSGVEYYLISPEIRDYQFVKYHYSAFTVDSFRSLLASRDIETVLLSGVDTHICIEGTARHGYDLGFRIAILSDLVGSSVANRDLHIRSLEVCAKYFALVVESTSLLVP